MSDEKKSDDYTINVPERRQSGYEPPKTPSQASPSSHWSNHPMVPILSYCASSISMTVANKYVLLGDFNLNFFFLCLQSVVCVLCVHTCKSLGFITYRNFNTDEARKWFPVSLLLVGMIYTGSKALKYLSIPVYTIFKNLTIIITAYGEVLWMGGSVSRLTLFSFGLIVFSSVVAAWGDIQHTLDTFGAASAEASAHISTLNRGYMWMMINCFCTTAYVLGMRKRIKLTNFKDFDTMFYNNFLTIPVLVIASLVVEDWSAENLARCFPVETRTTLLSAIALTGLVTVFISYTSAWCVRVTSGATYSMVGALNKIPIAVSGLVFFGDAVTLPNVSAIAIGSVSGIVYAVAKLKQSEAAKNAVGLPTTNRPVMSASSASARDSARA